MVCYDSEQLVLETLNKMKKSKSDFYVSSGFPNLDEMINGFEKGTLISIASRPSMGKTTFALNIVARCMDNLSSSVVVFSLNNSRTLLMKRLIAIKSGVENKHISNCNLDNEEWNLVSDAADYIAKSSLFINDSPLNSADDIYNQCIELSKINEIGIVIIDELQSLFCNYSRDKSTWEEEIAGTTRKLKLLAQELNIPILVLSQLNRNCECRLDHRPLLSDLRGSDGICNDADLIMLLYRDDYYNVDSDFKGIAELIIAKNSNGPTGTVEFVWIPELQQFKVGEYHE